MDNTKVVIDAATALRLLDGDGRLKTLDSLATIDFIMELERVTGIEIPTNEIRFDVFGSIEGVAKMLDRLVPKT